MKENNTVEYDTSFYDKESAYYSDKRYPDITVSYIQYIFKERLVIFLDMLEKIEKKLPSNASILEIGCADGVVFKAIEARFPGRFSKLVGMDVSPKMIDEAIKNNKNDRASFYLREDLPVEKFDLVIELGVHAHDLRAELVYVSNYLNSEGYFVYDSVGTQSLYYYIKLRKESYAKDYKTNKEYETFFKEFFSINETKVYGLFVPKLWKYPILGRNLQFLFDGLFRGFLPNLFHEKLYLLKKKGESTFE